MKSWKPDLPPFRANKKIEFEDISKTAQFIYAIGESAILRKPSKEVPLTLIETKEFQKKVKYLKAMMSKYRKIKGVGRGITAVQIGIPERFSVIYTPSKLLIIINPKITKKSKEKYLYPETCMSAQPVVAPTVRPAWIEFEYYDENGDRKYWNTKDKTKQGRMMNRVFQHEIDHMEGIINIDKLTGKDLFFDVDPKFYGRARFVKA